MSSSTTDFDSRLYRLRQYHLADPDNLNLQCDLCDALLDAGQTQEARETLGKALERQPDNAGLRYRLGVIQRRRGQLEAAQQTLSQLLESGADAPAIRYELACVQMMLGRSAQAAEHFLRLVQSEAYALAYPDADFFLLRTLHQNAQIEQAIAHGERVLNRGTNDPRVLGAMATLYIDNDQVDRAAQLLRSADTQLAQAEGLDSQLRAELESANGYVALSAEDLELAKRHFEASLTSEGQFGRSLLGLGLAQAALGDLPQAEALLQKTVQAMPTHLGSWHTLAWMQLAQDKLEGAEANFNHAMQLDPTFGESHGGLALMAALRGDNDKAKEFCRTALRLDKNSMNVLAAQLVMKHGSLKSPEILKTALPMLAKRPGLKGASMQESLIRIVTQRRRP